MKTNFNKLLYIFILCIVFSCQQEEYFESLSSVDNNYEISNPLIFATAEEATDAMKYDIHKTKTYVESFISYAETVMQEDDYDNRKYALQSESFGSILNTNGEVYINNYYIRLIDNGYIIALPEKASTTNGILFVHPDHLVASNAGLGVNDPNKLYEIIGYDGVYFYDSFSSLSDSIETKGTDEVIFPDDHNKDLTLGEMRYGFVFPKGSDQKVTFPGRDDIANDTKIHREDNIFVSNTGIKTKTMKKGSLGIWTKFDCNLEAGITDIVIEETWNKDTEEYKSYNLTVGWYDINKTTFPGGRKAMIATKYVIGRYRIPSNTEVANDCSDALTWAKQKGLDVDDVEGVRYIYSGDERVCVRLRNLGGNLVFDNKYVIDFDVAPIEGGKTDANKGLINKKFKPIRNCILQECIFYGYSEFNGHKRGSRASYNINN